MSCLSKDVKSDHKVLARGLLLQLTQPSFVLLNKFLSEFLDRINIANKVCQSKGTNIANVLTVIKECRFEISSLKDLYIYTVEKITRDFNVLNAQYSIETRPVRAKQYPRGSRIVDAPVQSHNSDAEDVIQEVRRVIVELCDCFESEMETRFSTDNTSLWSAMEALSLKHSDFLNSSLLEPFFDYMLTVPEIRKQLIDLHVDDHSSLTSECKVFKNVITRNFDENIDVDVGDIHAFLCKNYSDAAPILTALYKLSARVESLFSAMSYVGAPRRQRSGSERESSLTHLFFERKMADTTAEFVFGR